MLTPLFSRICSVRFVGCQNFRIITFPLQGIDYSQIRDIKTSFDNKNNIIIKFNIDELRSSLKERKDL